MNVIREQVEALVGKTREEVADALVERALARAGVVTAEEAFRDAVRSAYDYGRLAVVRELLNDTIRKEQDRIGGRVQ